MKTAQDPVCRMKVIPEKAKAEGLSYSKGGKTFYFCSRACLNGFSNESSRKLAEILLSAALVAVSAIAVISGYMTELMGVVFLSLAGLKLIDVRGFARMFEQYDLIASRVRGYALAYPFIELSLGLAYLFEFQVLAAAAITVFVMSIGSAGVWKRIRSRNAVRCACLGAKIKVPLTRFTLVEDVLMAAMGLMILITHFSIFF